MKTVRRVLLALAACLIVGGVCFWFIVLEPIYRYGQCNRRIRAKFETLEKRRPDNLTQPQWAFIVFWTKNAGGNCFGWDSRWPNDSSGFTDTVRKLEQFDKELGQRLEGPVDIKTIDWIWDEIVRIGYHGKKYSDNFRPTLPARLETLNPGAGVEVD